MRPFRIPVHIARSKASWTYLFLLAGVLIQAAIVLAIWLPELVGVRRAFGMPAGWRGANFSQGGRFADYVLFLNAGIPEEGRVVLPPVGFGPKSLGATPIMQFFLSPRRVINCTASDCIQNLSIENTYVLVVGAFPGEGAAGQFAEQRMFDDKWGVLRPVGAPIGMSEEARLPAFERMVDILKAALPPLLWLAVLALSGTLLVNWLAPGLPGLMQLSLGYGLGLSTLTVGLGLAWLAGAPLGKLSVYSATALLILAAAAFYRRRNPGIPDHSGKFRHIIPWVLIFLFVAGVAAFLAVGLGYSVSDEIVLWGAKGYGIAASGSLAHVQDWGTNTVRYPLHIPILIAAFKSLFGETLPASKLAFSGYYLALLLFTFSNLIWKGVRPSRAGLATALLGTIPLAFRHATLAYANLPLAYTLLCGVVLVSEALHKNGDLHPWRLYSLSGLMLCASAWARPEGLALALVGTLVLVGVNVLRRVRPAATWHIAALLLPIAVYGAFWIALLAAAYTRPAGRSDLLGNALAAISRGQLHLGEMVYILRRMVGDLFEPRIWGVLGMALLVAAILYLRRNRPHQPQASSLTLSGLVFIGVIIGMYYLTSYDTAHDISWWVGTGLGRMMLPAVFLLWIGLFLGAQPFDDREDGTIPANLEHDGLIGE